MHFDDDIAQDYANQVLRGKIAVGPASAGTTTASPSFYYSTTSTPAVYTSASSISS